MTTVMIMAGEAARGLQPPSSEEREKEKKMASVMRVWGPRWKRQSLLRRKKRTRQRRRKAQKHKRRKERKSKHAAAIEMAAEPSG